LSKERVLKRTGRVQEILKNNQIGNIRKISHHAPLSNLSTSRVPGCTLESFELLRPLHQTGTCTITNQGRGSKETTQQQKAFSQLSCSDTHVEDHTSLGAQTPLSRVPLLPTGAKNLQRQCNGNRNSRGIQKPHLHFHSRFKFVLSSFSSSHLSSTLRNEGTQLWGN